MNYRSLAPRVRALLAASSALIAGCAVGSDSSASPAPGALGLVADAGVLDREVPSLRSTQASASSSVASPAPAEGARTAAAPCSASALMRVDLHDAHALGGFTAHVAPDGTLSVRHRHEGDRTLFATPPDSPVELARAALEVEEHQGSFEVRENLGTQCISGRFDRARAGAGTLVLEGGFEDDQAACASLRFRLSLCETQPGHLSFSLQGSDPRFNVTVLRVASDAEERIYGMGEQAPHDTLDLKGRAIEVLAQEGGIGRGHVPITPAVNLVSPGSGGHEGSTYYAAPHYLTSRRRSLFLENTEYAVFDFKRDEVTRLRLFAPTMRGRILQGGSPLELIERFTEYAGRMPPLPDWVNEGAIVALARDPSETLPVVDALLQRGAAIAGVWNQTWSGVVETFVGEQVLWNWVQNPVSRPGWHEMVEALEQRNIRTLCYVNPMFRDVADQDGPLRRNLFQEGVDNGYFVRREDGSVYTIPVTAFEVGLLDLTNPEARAWMKAVLREEMMDHAGCSGWMADFAEALPFDASLGDGRSAAAYHNQYPVDWARLNREAVEEAGRLGDVLVFNRSGHTRTPGSSLLLWQGDQLTTWDKYDGLVSALHGLISGGLSGIALNHSDVGGYTSLTRFKLGYRREVEQLERWTEMNAFTAVLRTHEGNAPAENAQVYSSDRALDHFARFTKVYKALAFYRRQLFQEAAERGWPVVRHLMLHYPDDPVALRTDDEFLLGSEILVAPIKNKCWTRPWCRYNKRVYLPAGRWVHLWSGRTYGDTERGTAVTVRAPIGEPAVFYRAGSEVGEAFVRNLREAGIDAG